MTDTAIALQPQNEPDFVGMVEGMSFEDYAAVDALNGSSLVHMRRSPMKYRHEKDNPTAPTPAMILGTATHRLILEPHRVGDFAIWGEAEDQKIRNGKVWNAFQAAHAGQMIVTAKERDAMVGMSVGARRNLPIMKYASAKGPSEVSMFWTDKHTGRAFKGRLDKVIPSTHTIFDLKTTRDCREFKFGSQAYQLGYHIKAAIYWSGYRAITGHEPHIKFGAIESKPPYESAVYRATPDVILQGLEDLQSLLAKLQECEETGRWPAALEEEKELTLPSYAFPDPGDDLSDLGLEGV